MVLQADARIPIWGTAAPGEDIRVTIGDRTARARAGSDGKWRVDLEPMAASYAALTLAISGTNELEIRDVLIGEVWLCAGQSNMYFSLGQDADAASEIPKAGDPLLRLFKVPEQAALHPSFDLRGFWRPCDSNSAKGFSAVGYYFGKQLRGHLDRPVGLVCSSWGGSFIQAWMSLESLQQRPAFDKDIAAWQKRVAHYPENKDAYTRGMQDYELRREQWDAEVGKPYSEALAKWQASSREAKAKGQPVPPAPTPSRPGPPRPVSPDGDRSVATTPFNAMIAPWIPYALKGVLWYQGEGNIGPMGPGYFEMLSRLIRDWRQRWAQDDLTFVVVQLPFFHGPSRQPVEGSWAWVRDAQFQALTLPKTGLAVALDQGDPKTVHPECKREVGRRASLVARRVAYGESVVACGPIYQSMKIEGAQVRIAFGSVGSGLVTGPVSGSSSSTSSNRLSAFAVAGADRKWVWADARIDGNAVVVGSPEVAAPVAVRYGWGDNPPCNLYNREGLPASPFRTDDWGGEAARAEGSL